MKKNYKKIIAGKNSGFSLIETLFAVSIFVIISVVFGSLNRNLWLYNGYISNGLSGADTGRTLIKNMSSEIRTASSAETGSYTIASASASSFIFYSDVDSDGISDRVRYTLASGTLSRGIIKPTGSPLTYNSANEKVSTLATGVTNATVFEYYDKNYDGTTAALTTPINIPSVRLVKITVTIDKEATRPPAPMTFSTQISLRNLKDNL